MPKQGSQEHERTSNAVTNREELDAFFKGYDEVTAKLFGGLNEELVGFSPDTSAEDIQVFAKQKGEYVSRLVDRALTVGRETDKASLDLDNEAVLDRIKGTVHPIPLARSLLSSHERAFSRIPDALTADRGDILKVVEKQMMAPIFDAAIQTLGIYFEEYIHTPFDQRRYDPYSRRRVAREILRAISDVVLQTNPMDLRQCRDLFVLVAKYPEVIDGIDDRWYEQGLFQFAHKLNEGYASSQKEGLNDELFSECCGLLAPLFKEQLRTVKDLEVMKQWYDLISPVHLQIQTSDNPPPPYYSEGLLSLARKRTEDLLRQNGLPGKECMDAWCISEESERRYGYIARNLGLIVEMERKAPKAATVLNKEFGIKNFARHSLSFWLEQYRQRDDHTTPYGVLFSPSDDWNGAFSNGHLARLTDEATTQMNKKVLMRVVECTTKIDIPRKLIELKQRYQVPEGGHQISFVIVAGHGAEQSIRMGGPDVPPPPPPWPPIDRPSVRRPSIDLDLLTPEDMSGPGMKRLKTFFRPDAPIVLIACSTGKSGGIGEVMSRVYDASLTAPTIPTHVKQWHFTPTSDGQVVIQTEYFPDKKHPDTPTTASYKKGVRLSV